MLVEHCSADLYNLLGLTTEFNQTKGETKIVLQMEDPEVSRIQSDKQNNYLYPHCDNNSCQVQARALTKSVPINTDQIAFLTTFINSSICTSVGGAHILSVFLLRSRYNLLTAHLLYPILDPQRSGDSMNCIYFTELFRYNPQGLVKAITV